MAAAHFLCLTAEGGVPLFYRNIGNLKPLPFPVIGSLNGIHLFCKNHSVDLKSTTTEDSKVIWKDFHNSLSLILISQDDGCSDSHMTRLLDYAFQTMVLLYGFEDLTNIKNIDRFKREIRVCFKVLDRLLDSKQSSKYITLTRAVEMLAGPENTVLQSYIDAFAEAADSPYGCLMVDGKVVVATSKWWELSSCELVLLSLLMASLPRCSSRDVAVFLPDNSPTVPHRLLTFNLLPGVEVCVICGPSPALSELETEVDRFWRPSLDSLRSISRTSPRNIPSSIVLDSNILGFLLVNQDSHRCLCSVCPHTDGATRHTTGKSLSREERQDILCAFYKSVFGDVWPHTKLHREEDGPDGDHHEGFSQQVTDTYTCSDRHKCYALRSDPSVLLVLYTTAIPTYAMRSVTQKTLQALVKDKNVIV